MDTQTPGRRTRIPTIRFRVLIIGRANAGKTTILQRVCDTTGSPIIYRGEHWRNERVTLDPSIDRGEHTINDELMFSNDDRYVFHDSRGIESGGTEELGILQEFIRRKCRERRLVDRLHTIWYCVPMDNQRPQLDLKFFDDICPDRNVPVIAVFTKYDQFRRNVQIHLEDFGSPDDVLASDVADKQFEEHYLRPLGDDIRFVRLEKMNRQDMRCDELIETTAAALNNDVVGLMLLALQSSNLELSVKTALNRVRFRTGMKIEDMVHECVVSFPYIWLFSATESESLSLSEFDSLSSIYKRHERSEYLQHVMSLPTLQNLTGHHLIFAVILIFKHATFLRLEGLSIESALTQAELDYREGNIDMKIQEHLTGSSQDSVELSASFLMAINIEPSRSSVEAHSTMATDIEPSRSSVKVHVHGKEHWFKRRFKPAFTRKS